jgi:two-component system, cell cycle sensor histidine kinase and response regulator CckA
MRTPRRWFQDLSIRRKLVALFVALAVLAVLAVSLPLGAYDYFVFKRAIAQDLTILADVLAQNSSAALTFRDAEGASEVLQALRAEPNVTLACIYRSDGQPFAFYARDRYRTVSLPRAPKTPTLHFERDRLMVFRRIELGHETIGSLYIESDLGTLHDRRREYNRAFVVTALLTVAFAFLAAELFQRPISRPLLALVQTTKAISDREDYSIRAHLPNRDEFGRLVSAFNGMLEQIENRDRALREYHEHLEEQVVARASELSKANQQLALQAAALEAAANSIVITDCTGKIVWTNPAFSTETGYSAAEVLGKTPRILSSGRHDKTFYRQLWKTITMGQIWRGEIINRRKDGTIYFEEMSVTPVRSGRGEPTHFVAIKQNITSRKQAEDALRQAEEKYRGMFEDAVVGIYRTTPAGKVLSANRALAQMCGYDAPEQLIANINDVGRDLYHNPKMRESFTRQLMETGVVRNFEYQIRRRDGRLIWLLQTGRVLKNDKGEALFYEGTVHDITERKVLEEQLRQSQKMEAVGRLAGGVAHDFNNALGVIMGYGELLDLNLPPDDPMHKHAKEIIKAGQRAASLTRQLLAFSRKQTIQPVVLDLNSVVTDTEKMLQRLIGEDIDLTIVRESKLKNVKADRGQVGQILMNLAVNARDAMPGGGKLLIETVNAELTDEDARQFPYVEPGHFVLLRVSDTGCGMDANTVAHIFEPFFTTKAEGVGTGLGLSMVYGIVKQSNGYVFVDSEVGKGTAFRIYLPQVQSAPQAVSAAERRQSLPRGSETILLVEDEAPLRELARGCLQAGGYQILEACDGKTAIEVASQHQGKVDLLLTDVIMPGMDGCELAAHLSQSRSEIKVLFISGYTDDRLSNRGVLEPGVALLMKPFPIEALLVAVRNVLDGKAALAVGAS